jgi:hypothetical protein
MYRSIASRRPTRIPSGSCDKCARTCGGTTARAAAAVAMSAAAAAAAAASTASWGRREHLALPAIAFACVGTEPEGLFPAPPLQEVAAAAATAHLCQQHVGGSKGEDLLLRCGRYPGQDCVKNAPRLLGSGEVTQAHVASVDTCTQRPSRGNHGTRVCGERRRTQARGRVSPQKKTKNGGVEGMGRGLRGGGGERVPARKAWTLGAHRVAVHDPQSPLAQPTAKHSAVQYC